MGVDCPHREPEAHCVKWARHKGPHLMVKDHPDLIDRIEQTRQDNNRQWMSLLRLAVEAEPEKAKPILLQIKRNDSEIQRLLGELASS